MFCPNIEGVFVCWGDVYCVTHTIDINNADVFSHRKNGATQGGNHLPSLSVLSRVSLPDAPHRANASVPASAFLVELFPLPLAKHYK